MQVTVVVTAFRGTVPVGPKIPARSLAGYVARRRSYGHWESRLVSVGKAMPEAGSSGCAQLATIPSAPSASPAASAITTPDQHNLLRRRLRRQHSIPFDGSHASITAADGADANCPLSVFTTDYDRDYPPLAIPARIRSLEKCGLVEIYAALAAAAGYEVCGDSMRSARPLGLTSWTHA